MAHDHVLPPDSIASELMEAKQTSLPLGEVLARVSHEMTHLSKSMDQFQILISPLLVKGHHHDRAFLREIQNLDHVAQKLVCLSEFVNGLAIHMPPQWRIDPNFAAQVVTLAELSATLAASEPAPRRETSVSSGDCELF
ncbi:hypothetical protein [Beijerinckia indica]|uniref:Uncharacterized protein n=1 Tax=Beijerinckia indica subsp. indica (strain ATCC 9039 / DSM 1715 / NCIMB 8712) TaxID=395963 RepID=B2IGA8_BEII9|nr:hypothetical protein [Beijerinckia indica]ACB97182.1 hypothetical protein Bind_3629 [Beijerinckia indica subsp. indica ATCC 9039]